MASLDTAAILTSRIGASKASRPCAASASRIPFFEKSIRVTIEHGHANKLSKDYASTAYWYQSEPHKPFSPIPAVSKRIPR